MCTNCALFLPDVCLQSSRAKFLFEEKKISCAAFNSTFRYIDYLLPNNNDPFHSYVVSIYKHHNYSHPHRNKISYKNLMHCIEGKLNAQFYDKRDNSSTSLIYMYTVIFSDIFSPPPPSFVESLPSNISKTQVSYFFFFCYF
jgi:hypothetical protein